MLIAVPQFMSLKTFINRHEKLKKVVHWLLIPKGEARPRRWVSIFLNPFFHQKGRGVKVRRSVRWDVLPFNEMVIGDNTTIEDFSIINNGVGAVKIGARSLVGAGNVIIGPVTIGNDVIMAQHVVVSGLNHVYQDVHIPIRNQSVETSHILIDDECWIGANVVITAGTTIGKHCVIAAGSVVTRNIPAYCVAAGNPAKIIRRFDPQTNQWLREH